MLSRKRMKRTHKICPHCNKEINIKTFKDHKRLYYNEVSKTWIVQSVSKRTTVEPPNRGHFGTAIFVLSSEVVLFSEVVLYLP